MDKEISASAPQRFGGQKSEWTFPHGAVTSRILAAAIHVHRQLGPGIGVHRLDLVVEGKVVVELKAAKGIEDAHLATMLSYLRAARLDAGLILNFAGPKLAIRRVVCSAAEALRGGGAESLG